MRYFKCKECKQPINKPGLCDECASPDDLVIRHKNGKEIRIKPEPIGWTPPEETPNGTL